MSLRDRRGGATTRNSQSGDANVPVVPGCRGTTSGAAPDTPVRAVTVALLAIAGVAMLMALVLWALIGLDDEPQTCPTDRICLIDKGDT